MVELHGWVTIRENFTASDEEDCINQIVCGMNRKAEEMGIDRASLQISYSNGEPYATVTRYTNHFSEDIKQIIRFFRYIASVAPGSYGLLYLHDDEDQDGYDNAFQVYVLSKGSLVLQKDLFLSPYIPVVEDL